MCPFAVTEWTVSGNVAAAVDAAVSAAVDPGVAVAVVDTAAVGVTDAAGGVHLLCRDGCNVDHF